MTTWLTIAGNFRPPQDEIPPYVKWLWQVAKTIDTDTAWVGWWTGSPVAALALHPSPDSEVDFVSVHRESGLLRVRAGSKALSACTDQASSRDEAERMVVDAPARWLFLELLQAMFARVGNVLELTSPPPLPSTVFGEPGG